MRKPRLEDFDPKKQRYDLEEIDLSHVTPIQSPKFTQHHMLSSEKQREVSEDGIVIPRHHETTVGTTTPRYHDTVAMVRKAVKELGKEAATHRFTAREKQEVAEIIFDYQRKGIRTSENEITRIGLNYLIEDYRQHGDESILAKVLKELNA